MMNYVRRMFRLDYCTPRYMITKKTGMDKLKIKWEIRAKRFEKKIRNRERSIVEQCWREKRKEVGKICMGWKKKDVIQGTDG